MKEQFKKLIDLKSIITILMVSTLIYGFISGKVTNEEFIPLATLILSFYFAKKGSNQND